MRQKNTITNDMYFLNPVQCTRSYPRKNVGFRQKYPRKSVFLHRVKRIKEENHGTEDYWAAEKLEGES